MLHPGYKDTELITPGLSPMKFMTDLDRCLPQEGLHRPWVPPPPDVRLMRQLLNRISTGREAASRRQCDMSNNSGKPTTVERDDRTWPLGNGETVAWIGRNTRAGSGQ